MDVGKAVTFVNEDPKWVSKLLIGAVLSFFAFLLVPIPELVGYVVAVARNVMNGLKEPLPEWGEDWGKLFMDGLYVVIAQIVYSLPFWILSCIALVISIGSAGLGEISEDLAVASLMASFGLVFCLGILWWIALIVLTPAILIQYVRTGDFGACFRFGEVFGLTRQHLSDILITVVVGLAASIVIGAVSAILQIVPCLGAILAMIFAALAGPWLMFSFGHLYGQIASKTNGNVTKLPA